MNGAGQFLPGSLFASRLVSHRRPNFADALRLEMSDAMTL
jgi:hypothetical protein